MDDRVHRYLDGELTDADLTAEEREAAREFEGVVAALGDASGGFEATDLRPAVMRRIAASVRARPAPTGPWRWLLERRSITLSLRPIEAMAAVAAAVLLVAVSWGTVAGLGDAADPAAEPTVFVRFELEAPEASSVRLAGSFSGWSPDIPLQRAAGGTWRALVPLTPGVHDYAFQVDGERWAVDPGAPRVADGFGGYNSRLSLVMADS
ncbi:MAG: glycogen-binding domain-containing protein [Gemmatimonadota bacterium]